MDSAKLTDLPVELIECICSYLDPADIATFQIVCRRFRNICQFNRWHLPQKRVRLLSCRFGEWHDILSHKRRLSKKLIKYVLSDPVPHPHISALKSHRSLLSTICSLLKHKKCCKTAPFHTVISSCAFESAMVDVQLLSPDLRNLMCFDKIKVNYLIVNLSHASLFLSRLSRYLPLICEDLAKNGFIKKISFVFLSTTFSTEGADRSEIKQWFQPLRNTPAEFKKSVNLYFVRNSLTSVLELGKCIAFAMQSTSCLI